MNPVAHIDLAALRHNLDRIKSLAPKCKVMPVLKANGYGHGVMQLLNVLDDVDAIALARVDEAVVLRQSGYEGTLIILEGFFNEQELTLSANLNLELVVHHEFQIELLDQVQKPVRIWLKIETGMQRLGLAPDKMPIYKEQIHAMPQIKLIGVLTHFANADLLNHNSTADQIDRFNKHTNGALEQSMANSSGILYWPQSRKGWVRPGIMLYGVSPAEGRTAKDEGLQPVMTLTTTLMCVREVKKGESIGYGSRYLCTEDMPVGVAAIGYGDGYPRHAVDGTPVLVNGQRAQLAGRVSMDMITIDLRGITDTKTGDEVILWGRGLPIEEVARASSTIGYELLCRLTERVQFKYHEA